MMMYHLLSTLLLLLTSAIAVHSTPLSAAATTTTTKKFLRRTEEAGETKKISNDDPDRIDFGFVIQTNSPPTDVQRVADALESFGTTLFDTSAEYSNRFMSFEVDPVPSTSVAVSRGGWKQRRHLEEQSHSSPFVATLTLDKSTNIDGSSVQEEEVKQFFLNALQNAATSTDDTTLGSLLGQWKAVETDAVPQAPPAATTTSTGSEGGNSDPVPSASSEAETVVVKSPTTTTSSYGSINSAVGISLGVIGACLVIFLVAVFAQRHNTQRHNRRGNTPTTTEDHIGDVHVNEDIENSKPKITVGMWAAGLLPATNRSKSNNKETGTFPTAAPVEANKIDKVLADMHLDSDDSSFVSAESGADTSCYSGYSGMTGISDLNYQPKSNETGESKQNTLDKVEEVKPSISFLDQTKGSLIRESSSLSTGASQSVKKEDSFDSDPSGSKGTMGKSQSMRKEESFQNDYREKSAMATLNLKKDMLNADVGEDDKARTLSAQQNSEMMQQQRQVDKERAATVRAKKRVKNASPPSRKDASRSLSPTKRVVEAEPDESRDHLLPPPVEKSDDPSDSKLEIV